MQYFKKEVGADIFLGICMASLAWAWPGLAWVWPDFAWPELALPSLGMA